MLNHDEPLRAGKYLVVKIDNPIYETDNTYGCRVRDVYVNKAIRNNLSLVVRCPGGESKFDPKKIKETAKVFKQVFKFPDNPMILYEVNVDKGKHTENEQLMFG